jgi:endo-1,4-beta-xylanase
MYDPPAHPKRRGLARLLFGGTVALVLAAATAGIVPGVAKAATQVCSNQTGTNGGMYYQMYVSTGSACITLNSANSYSTTWSGIGDFVAGVGWNPGNTSAKSFTASLSASGGTSLVSLYGWSTNPLVEYYVTENYVGSPNTAGTYEGQVTSDGGTFNIYEHQQVNQPCITGNSCTFEQYLAYRTSPVSSGTITFQNFVNAWASHGMNLGTMNYQIMATESYGGGSGNSNVTVSQGSSTTGNTVSVTSPGNQSGTVGTAASVQVHATDSGGAALTYSASGLPAGLSINSSTGLISGTPTTAGTSSVTVTAKDSTGATGSATFSWAIASSGGGGGTGGGACHVTYTTNSQWPGGFTAQVVIGNTSTSAISSWSLAFTFPGDQKITSNFNGGFSQTGETATLTNASYNGAIAPGGSITDGFQGTWTNSDAAPTAFTLNGATCT